MAPASFLLSCLSLANLALAGVIPYKQQTKSTGKHIKAQAVPYHEDAEIHHIRAEKSKEVVYGAADRHGNVLYGLANFVAPSDQPDTSLVSLESFIPFIKTIDCQVGSIRLSFVDDSSYKEATTWPQSFLLFTATKEYCGSDDRTMYNVTERQFHPRSHSVTLDVTDIPMAPENIRHKLSWGTLSADILAENKHTEQTSTDTDIRVHKIARSIREFHSSGLQRRDTTWTTPDIIYHLTPNMVSFHVANWPNNIYGRNGLVLECQSSSGWCGITADVNMNGEVDNSGTGTTYSLNTTLLNLTLDSTFTVIAAGPVSINEKSPIILGQLNMGGQYEFPNIGGMGYTTYQTSQIQAEISTAATMFNVGFNTSMTASEQIRYGTEMLLDTYAWVSSSDPSVQSFETFLDKNGGTWPYYNVLPFENIDSSPAANGDWNMAYAKPSVASSQGYLDSASLTNTLGLQINALFVPASYGTSSSGAKQKRQEPCCEGLSCLFSFYPPCDTTGYNPPPPPSQSSPYGITYLQNLTNQYNFPSFSFALEPIEGPKFDYTNEGVTYTCSAPPVSNTGHPNPLATQFATRQTLELLASSMTWINNTKFAEWPAQSQTFTFCDTRSWQ